MCKSKLKMKSALPEHAWRKAYAFGVVIATATVIQGCLSAALGNVGQGAFDTRNGRHARQAFEDTDLLHEHGNHSIVVAVERLTQLTDHIRDTENNLLTSNDVISAADQVTDVLKACQARRLPDNQTREIVDTVLHMYGAILGHTESPNAFVTAQLASKSCTRLVHNLASLGFAYPPCEWRQLTFGDQGFFLTLFDLQEEERNRSVVYTVNNSLGHAVKLVQESSEDGLLGNSSSNFTNLEVNVPLHLSLRPSAFTGEPCFTTGNSSSCVHRVQMYTYKQDMLHRLAVVDAAVADSVAGPVISYTVSVVLNRNISVLLNKSQNAVKMAFKTYSRTGYSDDMRCVAWDYSINGGNGGWRTRGCMLVSAVDTLVVCKCNQLGTFAVINSQWQTAAEQNFALLLLRSCGGFGMACLIVAIYLQVYGLAFLHHSRSQSKEKRQQHIVMLMICANYLIAAVCQVFGMAGFVSYGSAACWVVSCGFHYSCLAFLFSTALEGRILYLYVVKVFTDLPSHFLLTSFAFVQGVPAVIVAVTASVTANSGYILDDNDAPWCRIDHSKIAVGVGYMMFGALAICHNLYVYARVISLMCRMHSPTPKESRPVRRAAYRLRSSVIIFAVLGLGFVPTVCIGYIRHSQSLIVALPVSSGVQSALLLAFQVLYVSELCKKKVNPSTIAAAQVEKETGGRGCAKDGLSGGNCCGISEDTTPGKESTESSVAILTDTPPVVLTSSNACQKSEQQVTRRLASTSNEVGK